MPPISARSRPSPRLLATCLVLLLVAALGYPGTGASGAVSRTGHGVLEVGTSPDLDASIIVDGEARNSGAIAGLQLPAGTHDVCFGGVEGYLSPACQLVDIVDGQTTSVTGAFVPAGRLDVEVEPAGLAPVITVSGVERDRGTTSLQVAAGSHEVCFESLSGYADVPCQQASIDEGATVTVVGSYDVVQTPPADGSASSRVDADLVSLYDFAEGSGSVVSDVAGKVDGLDLEIADPTAVSWTDGGLRFDRPTMARTGAAPAALYDAVAASGEFTVEAWVTPANTTQNGPARIVTLGKDTSHTNFLVGQGAYKGDSRLIESRLHLRTGDYKLQTEGGSLSADLTHVVMTRAADSTVRLYLDGELATSQQMAADLDGWDPSYLLALGAELDGDRPWLGTFHLVALYDSALDGGEVTTNFVAGPDGQTAQPTTPVEEPAPQEPDDEDDESDEATPPAEPEPSEPEPGEPAPTEPDPSAGVSHGVALERSQVGLAAGWSGVASGRVVSTRDGQVIEGLDVSVSGGSAIVVRHDDVTVRNNRVSHRDGANGVTIERGVTGATVEHNDFDGHYRTQYGNSGSIGIVAYGQLDAHRNHFRGGRDGLHVYGTDSQVTENWITDLHRNPGAHNDSVYIGGFDGHANVTVARNRTVAGNSGAIDLYALRNPIQGVDIVDNLIVGVGKGFGIYGGRTHTHYLSNRDIRIEGNRFTGTFAYPMVTGEGTNAAVDLSRPGNTFTDNRWIGSTTDLPARCGISGDGCQG